MMQVISRNGVPLKKKTVTVRTTALLLINDPLNPGRFINKIVETEHEQEVYVDTVPEPQVRHFGAIVK